MIIRRQSSRPEAALQWLAQHGVADVATENLLEVRNEGDCAVITLDGSIGKSWWDDSGITAKEVNEAINSVPVGQKIKLRVNSEGGSVKEGLGIYDSIEARSSDITCRITGYALSIASVFPLAAGRIESPDHAIWMSHEAWMSASGNKRDMRKNADMLETHDGALAKLYAKRTGKSEAYWAAKMEAETWFTGAEAVKEGLADELGAPDDVEAKAALRPIFAEYATRCRNIPANILNALAPRKGTGAPLNTAAPQPAGNTTPTPQESTMNKKVIVALLLAQGIKDSTGKDFTEQSPDAEFETGLNALAAKKDLVAEDRFKAIEAKLELAETKRITDKVLSYVEAGKITNDEAAIFVNAARTDEKGTFAILDKKEVAAIGGDPIGFNRIELVEDADFGNLKGPKSEALVNIHKQHKTVEARYAAKKSNWKQILDAACRKDAAMGRDVFAANTYSGTLVTSFLMDGSVTDLQNVWAALKAFSMDFSVDPYKPLATGVLKHVTAGATTQTDATNFESGNSTVAPVSVTMHQYSQSFQVSNSDLNSGLRMQDLVRINTANFANKVIEVATAPITTAIFTATPLVSAAAAFGFSDLATLQGQLKKSPIKNLILDGNYIARIANSPGFFQQAGVVGGDTGAWKAFGWDMIAQNTDWTGAGANVVGFACNPQAIAGITGLPLIPPAIPGGIFSSSTAVVPGLEASILVSTWFNPATRTMWSGMDIMAGFKEVDTTAGICITSA